MDGSDEVYRSKLCDRRTQYDCKIGGNTSCIPVESVCNKGVRCLNKPNCSIDICDAREEKEKCSHKCINTVACACPSGMMLDEDQRTCK